MYLILKRGKLREILRIAIKKAGNIRELDKIINIRRSTLSDYHMEKRPIIDINLKKLMIFTNIITGKEDIIKELPNNFKQIKGGKNCVKIKRSKGVLEKQLALCRAKSKNNVSKWHEKMRKNNPEEYYKSQYEKFKLVGRYKFRTKKGEKVRNKLEKEIADILYDLKIDYEYEPLVKSNNKYFFPDFLLKNKIIIECTMWRGEDKAIKLKEKIVHLEHEFKVYVVIPKHLNNYYQILDSHLIKGLDEFVPVAQTF